MLVISDLKGEDGFPQDDFIQSTDSKLTPNDDEVLQQQ